MLTVAEIDRTFSKLFVGFVDLQNEIDSLRRKLDAVREIIACTDIPDDIKVTRIMGVIKNGKRTRPMVGSDPVRSGSRTED